MAAASHQIKLFYFPIRGRAEHIRQILKFLNVPFEDVQILRDQWPTLKEEMPLGQVPVLEVDGVKIGQSVAIARYLGEEYGLAPKDNLARARLDMLVDQMSDTQCSNGMKQWPLICLGVAPCDNKRVYFREKVRPVLDNCASSIEKFLVENAANSLLYGDNVTWADIFAAEFFSKFSEYGENDCLEAYPHIQALVGRVHNEPAIKKHIHERAQTKY